jgi:ADP-ribose pyrophosphatase YjhB (NUDIX family)
VGAIVTDRQGRLLMIKRGHDPGAGLWSIPGGRIEPGETDAEALVREMIEETGLTVEVGRLIGRVRRPGLSGAVVDIRDYAATVTGGTLRPGDDAADARWVAPAELESLDITEGLIDALADWGVLGGGQLARVNSNRSAACVGPCPPCLRCPFFSVYAPGAKISHLRSCLRISDPVPAWWPRVSFFSHRVQERTRGYQPVNVSRVDHPGRAPRHPA